MKIMSLVTLLFVATNVNAATYDCKVSKGQRVNEAYAERNTTDCGTQVLDTEDSKNMSAYFDACGVSMNFYALTSVTGAKGSVQLSLLEPGKAEDWERRDPIAYATYKSVNELPEEFAVTLGRDYDRLMRNSMHEDFSAVCTKR